MNGAAHRGPVALKEVGEAAEDTEKHGLLLTTLGTVPCRWCQGRNFFGTEGRLPGRPATCRVRQLSPWWGGCSRSGSEGARGGTEEESHLPRPLGLRRCCPREVKPTHRDRMGAAQAIDDQEARLGRPFEDLGEYFGAHRSTSRHAEPRQRQPAANLLRVSKNRLDL